MTKRPNLSMNSAARFWQTKFDELDRIENNSPILAMHCFTLLCFASGGEKRRLIRPASALQIGASNASLALAGDWIYTIRCGGCWHSGTLSSPACTILRAARRLSQQQQLPLERTAFPILERSVRHSHTHALVCKRSGNAQQCTM